MKSCTRLLFHEFPTLLLPFGKWRNRGPRKPAPPGTISRTEPSSTGSSSFSPEDPASRGRDLLGGLAHPQPAPKDGDLAPSLLLALPPLHQVEAVVDGQCDIPLAYGGVDGTGQQVGLRLQCHLHAVGQQQPQGAIRPYVVAVPDLVWGRGEGQTLLRRDEDGGWCVYSRGSGVVFKCVYFSDYRNKNCYWRKLGKHMIIHDLNTQRKPL